MKELISPEQSETLVTMAALLLTLALGAYSWRLAGKRGALLALLGPLLWLSWRAHVYITRFDPQTGYFGLDKVSVLLGEVLFAVVLGVLVGKVWNRMLTQKS